MKLSIIVPVYNVEKYIRNCIESIFQQGLNDNDFEVIIINDGTKDESMAIIDGLTKSRSNVIIINQQNQGLSKARNNGMVRAKGDYLLFLDSDDLLVEQSISALLNNIQDTKADLIVAGFIRMTNVQIDNSYQSIKSNSFEIQETTGLELLLKHLNPRECYVWRTLYKREFLFENNINFIPNICFEDIPFTHECYLKAKYCLITSEPIYIYRIRTESISSSINIKTGIDFGSSIAKTWELTSIKDIIPEAIQKVKDDIFIALSVLLYSTAQDIPSSKGRKQILDHLKQVAPHMSFTNGLKQRFVNLMFHHMLHTYVSLRVIHIKVFKNNKDRV